MKTSRKILLGLCGLSAMSLAACGEGWEPVKFRGRVPYVEERTAGPGIEYVRAHLMPEKTIVLPAETQIQDAAPIFDKKMEKGGKK